MFEFFTADNLNSPNQSGFKPGDSCINQPLSITREICQSFDNSFEVWGLFLDASKAFDKVWHDGLIFKLSQYTIPGNLLQLVKGFLKNPKQRVGPNDQASSWANILANVSQGSILRPLFFYLHQ